MDETRYHALIPDHIFMTGAEHIPELVENEQIRVIVDLREEAKKAATNNKQVQWIKIPLGDHATEPQENLFKKAIRAVAAYRRGEKVSFHCGAGKSRTGTVAAGTLLELGICSNVEEAAAMAKNIRPIIAIKPEQMTALRRIYS